MPVTKLVKYSAAKVLAINLRKAIDDHPEIDGQSALARKSLVAQTSIGYMLKPESRAPTKKGRSSPTLANIENVATALGLQVWQLLYPDPEAMPRNEHEAALYRKFAALMKEMQAAASASSPQTPKPIK